MTALSDLLGRLRPKPADGAAGLAASIATAERALAELREREAQLLAGRGARLLDDPSGATEAETELAAVRVQAEAAEATLVELRNRHQAAVAAEAAARLAALVDAAEIAAAQAAAVIGRDLPALADAIAALVEAEAQALRAAAEAQAEARRQGVALPVIPTPMARAVNGGSPWPAVATLAQLSRIPDVRQPWTEGVQARQPVWRIGGPN